LTICVLIFMKSKMRQSHQCDDDCKQVEIFSISAVTVGVSVHSVAASGGSATSVVCHSSLADNVGDS